MPVVRQVRSACGITFSGSCPRSFSVRNTVISIPCVAAAFSLGLDWLFLRRIKPVPNEYAWGTDRIPAANGPVPDDDGVAARASYWGILGLSDNMGERTVTVGNAVGRRFPGTHGDGALAAPASQHDLRDKRPPGWHGLSMVGIGHRGGSRCGGGCMSKMYQIYEDLRLRTSDRYWATSEHPSLLLHPRQQYFTSGFRFVRTAPRGRFPLSPGHLRRMVFLTGPASSMVLQSPNKQEPLIPLAH